MAQRKKATALRKRAERHLKALENLEKDLSKVKSNLDKFLNQTSVRSADEYFQERREKIRRRMTRRR